ncbi:MAG: putative sulfate exporter family transporter [Solibacillus sp.]
MIVTIEDQLKGIIMDKKNFIYGILLTFLIASSSYMLAKLPILSIIGPLALAIFMAIIIRNFFFNPTKWQKGITFSAKKILRFAIILYGVRLNMVVIFDEGLPYLVRAVFAVIIGIGVMLLLAKWLKVDSTFALLLGGGTGICGAAAIGAISPIVRADDDDTALAVGMISLVGTLFALAMPFLGNVLQMSPEMYGQWVGLSVHEVAHAALAGAAFGDESLAPAFLAKLSRVLLLVPVTMIIVWIVSRKQQTENTQKPPFPYFVLGFLAISIISTITLENGWMSVEMQQSIATFASFLLAMSMAGLGLSINLKQLQAKAIRPLLLLTLTSVILFAAMLVLV